MEVFVTFLVVVVFAHCYEVSPAVVSAFAFWCDMVDCFTWLVAAFYLTCVVVSVFDVVFAGKVFCLLFGFVERVMKFYRFWYSNLLSSVFYGFVFVYGSGSFSCGYEVECSFFTGVTLRVE